MINEMILSVLEQLPCHSVNESNDIKKGQISH